MSKHLWLLPLIAIGILCSFNLLMVASLAPNSLGKQVLVLLLGILFFFLGQRLNPEQSPKNYWLIFILSCIILVFPLLRSTSTRGAKRWLDIGITSVQPSEFSKPALMIFLSNSTSPLFFLIPILLIALQPDLGSAITNFILIIPIIFSSPKLIKLTAILLIIATILSPLIWQFALRDYQKNRILTFINPANDPLGKGYHAIQSKIAIGSGGLLGKGYRKGTQGQLLFLPEKHTDFIFAATVEELGLIGATIIIFAYYLLISGLINKARVAANQPRYLFTLGIAILIWVQAVINIGMNIGILPVTGIPLPFLSVGGSSLVSLMLSLGVIYSS